MAATNTGKHESATLAPVPSLIGCRLLPERTGTDVFSVDNCGRSIKINCRVYNSSDAVAGPAGRCQRPPATPPLNIRIRKDSRSASVMLTRWPNEHVRKALASSPGETGIARRG